VISLPLSLLLLGLFGWHAWQAWRSWARFGDVRSLRYLVTAVMLLAGAMGLSVGALLVIDRAPEAEAWLQAIVGASRVVLLIGGIYLVLSWRRG
jgi:hypothetical protein